jgi:hypothetical protein
VDTETLERLDRLERRLDEFDSLLEYLMLLAAKHPAGRVFLKLIAKKVSK